MDGASLGKVLDRKGYNIIAFDTSPYLVKSNMARKIASKIFAFQCINKLNSDILSAYKDNLPDCVLFFVPYHIRAQTIREIRSSGDACLASYYHDYALPTRANHYVIEAGALMPEFDVIHVSQERF